MRCELRRSSLDALVVNRHMRLALLVMHLTFNVLIQCSPMRHCFWLHCLNRAARGQWPRAALFRQLTLVQDSRLRFQDLTGYGQVGVAGIHSQVDELVCFWRQLN